MTLVYRALEPLLGVPNETITYSVKDTLIQQTSHLPVHGKTTLRAGGAVQGRRQGRQQLAEQEEQEEQAKEEAKVEENKDNKNWTEAATGGGSSKDSTGSHSSTTNESAAKGPNATARASIAGSCFCYCPPGEGYGQCFDVPTNASKGTRNGGNGHGNGNHQTGDRDPLGEDLCAAFGVRAADFCPSVGTARQCGVSATAPVADCEEKNTECSVVQACPNRSSTGVHVGGGRGGRGGTGAAPAAPFDTLHCTCRPTRYDFCTYTPNVDCDTARMTNPAFRLPIGHPAKNRFRRSSSSSSSSSSLPSPAKAFSHQNDEL